MRPLAISLIVLLLAGCATTHPAAPGYRFASTDQCLEWVDSYVLDAGECRSRVDGQAVGAVAVIVLWVALYAAIIAVGAR